MVLCKIYFRGAKGGHEADLKVLAPCEGRKTITTNQDPATERLFHLPNHTLLGNKRSREQNTQMPKRLSLLDLG